MQEYFHSGIAAFTYINDLNTSSIQAVIQPMKTSEIVI